MTAPPIRVIGRIDLAEQILAVLRGSGMEAELYTGGPMSAGAGITADSPGVDVVAVAGMTGLDVCHAVKRAARTRPVVAVTWPDATEHVRTFATGAFGPDAQAPWPATGAEIVAACARAGEVSKVRRPAFARAWIPSMVAMAVSVACWVAAAIIGWPWPWGLGPEPGPLPGMLNALGKFVLGIAFLLVGHGQLGMRSWNRIVGGMLLLIGGSERAIRLFELYWRSCP